MAEHPSADALKFKSITFDIVEHRPHETWLRSRQLVEALGFAKDTHVLAVYSRHANEFTNEETALISVPTTGGMQQIRIFSLRGALLLGMFARTEQSAEFRRWAIKVLEREVERRVRGALPVPAAVPPALPAPEPAPGLVALPPVDTAAIQLERVTAERDIMRRLLGDRLLKDKPHYRHVVRYFKIPGLTHVERARLMGWKTPGQLYDALRELSACGIIDYQPDPQKQAMGRRRVDALRREGRAGSGDHLGVSPEGMAAARKARSERLAKIKKAVGHV